ncbi:hypothetical protein ABPG75_005726 [Micractinium tetrahymenae]
MVPVVLGQRSSPLRGQAALCQWQRRRLQSAGRQRRQACKAQGGGSPGQPSRDEVLARINRAKEYKRQAPEAARPKASSIEAHRPATATAAAPSVPAPLVEPTSEDVVQTFNDAAQALAAKEEASFLAAISQAQQSSRSSSSASGGGGSSTGQQGPGAAGLSSPGTSGAPSKEAVLARINAARQYKQGGAAVGAGSSSGGSGSPGKPAVHPPPPQPAAATQQAQPQGQQPLAAQPLQPQGQPSEPSASQQQQQQLDAAAERSFRTGAGGADEAANWLKFAESSGGGASQIDASLSAEQFTIAKEELKKLQEVEIVTVDAGYAERLRREKRAQQGGAAADGNGAAGAAAAGAESEAEAGSEEDLHKPKVATWGLFPRPRNISEAYGGGRNLRPGQALETEEQAAARQQRVSAALKEYRKTLGLDIDPATEAKAQAMYNEGVRLFDQGLITAALPRFSEASELMVLRSRLGGEARLQQAICLDSLGRNSEAYEIYKRIENHPAPGVAKKAKRMLFGWKAADQLKTQTLSYTPTTSQWKRYFDTYRNSLYSGTYMASLEEDESSSSGGAGEVAAALLATAIVLLPLAFVAYRILLRG